MRSRRAALRAPESLEAILDRAGENRFARVRPPIAAKVWREAVGARIAERARPVSLFGGVLVLRVPTSVWAHELSLLGEELCARVRQHGIDVRQLRFQVGSVPAVDRPPERRLSRPVPCREVPAEPPHEVAVALAAMRDAGLREVIARAAASNLAWQEITRAAHAPEETIVSEARRAARAPRFAEGESAPPGPGSAAFGAEAPGTPSDGRGRFR